MAMKRIDSGKRTTTANCSTVRDENWRRQLWSHRMKALQYLVEYSFMEGRLMSNHDIVYCGQVPLLAEGMKYESITIPPPAVNSAKWLSLRILQSERSDTDDYPRVDFTLLMAGGT